MNGALEYLRRIQPEDYFGWGAPVLHDFGIVYPSDYAHNRVSCGAAFRAALLDPTGSPTSFLSALLDHIYDTSQAMLDGPLAANIAIRFVAVLHRFNVGPPSLVPPSHPLTGGGRI